MRHKKRERKFAKSRGQHKMLFHNLTSSLVLKEKITTTEAKAKELRSFAEKIITRAKQDSITNRRFLSRGLTSKIIKKLFQELGPRYKNRSGGYTKITKTISRKSDGARMAVIELIK